MKEKNRVKSERRLENKRIKVIEELRQQDHKISSHISDLDLIRLGYAFIGRSKSRFKPSLAGRHFYFSEIMKGLGLSNAQPHVMTAKKKKVTEKTASKDFLASYQWRRVRMEALKANDGRCECCGRGRNHGVILHVDHIKPRKKYPELALDPHNLQVLCEICNHGKGNWDETDWR